jgi:HEAT repeat protein
MLGPPTTPEAALKQAVQLQAEYHTEKEFLPRVEIIYRLADASTPQARGVLSSLFFRERDLDLRVQMVNALPFVDSGDLNLSLPILQEALKAGQPRELREAGLDTIQTLNNPQMLPLLQPLLNDPDVELRETAARTIEYYKEVLQLDSR